MLKCHWVLCSSAIEYYTQVPLSTILKCHWVLCSRPLSIIFKCHWVLYSSSVTSLTVFSWFCLTLFGDINCNNWQVLTKCPKRLDSFVEATLKSLTILAAGHAEPRLVVWQGFGFSKDGLNPKLESLSTILKCHHLFDWFYFYSSFGFSKGGLNPKLESLSTILECRHLFDWFYFYSSFEFSKGGLKAQWST